MTLVGTGLNLGEKMKIYLQVLTFSLTPQTWLFQVVALLTAAKKWTKMKSARAGREKLLFLPTVVVVVAKAPRSSNDNGDCNKNVTILRT